MDPNETLGMLREASGWSTNITKGSPEGDFALDILSIFESLDEWLSKGGFLPDEWKR